MGSKGFQTTTPTRISPIWLIAHTQAAGQALQGAGRAAAQPFQMPVAPVAGFNPHNSKRLII